MLGRRSGAAPPRSQAEPGVRVPRAVDGFELAVRADRRPAGLASPAPARPRPPPAAARPHELPPPGTSRAAAGRTASAHGSAKSGRRAPAAAVPDRRGVAGAAGRRVRDAGGPPGDAARRWPRRSPTASCDLEPAPTGRSRGAAARAARHRRRGPPATWRMRALGDPDVFLAHRPGGAARRRALGLPDHPEGPGRARRALAPLAFLRRDPTLESRHERSTATMLDTPAGPLTHRSPTDGARPRPPASPPTRRELLPLVHPTLREPAAARAADLGPVTRGGRGPTYDGDLTALDAVPVEQRTGGAFLAHAWQVLREVRPGAPVTYTEFAALAGRPAAVRAAAAACARNAAALFVPVPPGAAHRRHARRLPLGATGEAVAAGPRDARARLTARHHHGAGAAHSLPVAHTADCSWSGTVDRRSVD